MINPNCPHCKGQGWVCEDHPSVAWDDGNGCCGGAGMPCICNNSNNDQMPEMPDTKLIWHRERGYLN